MTEDSRSEKRSIIPIAVFIDGYAAGWKMAVMESHRQSLDIRLTERKYGDILVKEWTQGNLFSFYEGCIFYDDKIVYKLDWREALQSIQLMVQILEASPATSAKKNERGEVLFKASKPNADGSGIEAIGQFKTSQDEFVRFLQTGKFHILEEKKLSPNIINLF